MRQLASSTFIRMANDFISPILIPMPYSQLYVHYYMLKKCVEMIRGPNCRDKAIIVI